ncbi:MAG: UDP-glucose 4-epimerase [Paenibacillaceae bacterium]|jgi:UDP-glucose 4-epimerase|nr:UDP-glucose 4-epimerase [Paenibacillaceae bacterium]
MKILITGGAGFIGSHVAEAYLEAGHEVVIVDDLSTGRREQVPEQAAFYKLDIRSDGMDAIIERERPDAVSHHAAQKSIPKSVADPLHDSDVNITATLRLLSSCICYGVKRFIFASTGGALAGDSVAIPTPETAQPVMLSPYAISKYTIEQYLRFYQRSCGLEFVALRYANVYGPRQQPDGECGVIPIFMNNSEAGLPSVLYSYPDMPKGTTRDYVYIRDVCRANVAALTCGGSEVINIGSGQEIHIADIYEAVCVAMGTCQPLKTGGVRSGDLRRSALDCSKAQQLLHWSSLTTLSDGLRETAAWHRLAR